MLILLGLTINGCKTIEYVYPEYELPEEPKRELKEEPKDLKDMADLIIYYKKLVEEWEQWAENVKKIITYEKREEK